MLSDKKFNINLSIHNSDLYRFRLHRNHQKLCALCVNHCVLCVKNGVWQDGGLLIHYPSRNQWMAGFFAFQSQSFHTNDVTGDPLNITPDNPLPLDPTTPSVSAEVRIVAALVNPSGADPGKESVTLINVSPTPVDLKGWALADRLKRKHTLDGTIQPGAVMTVILSGIDIQLSNDGGIITLLNKDGLKIDGVSYTKEGVNKQGWTTVF